MAILEISKEFDCSKEKLYKAWTEPDQLKEWWKPLGNQLNKVDSDIRPGGAVKYQFENNGLLIDGVYEKAEDNLLEYSWNWHVQAEPIDDAEYRLSVQFEGDEHTASLTVKQDGFKDDVHIKPHQQGWEDALEQLKIYLEQPQQTHSSDSSSQKQHPPIAGYMETPEQQKVGGG